MQDLMPKPKLKKVMLAANERINIARINYPVLASGKLDGVRGNVQQGALYSRSGKQSINPHVSAILGKECYEGLDGELCVPGVMWQDFNTNQSAFMTQWSKPDFVFHVFDDISASGTAEHRKDALRRRVAILKAQGHPVEFCYQHIIHTPAELQKLYDTYRAKGYEGLIVMKPSGLYKNGRSTLKQEIMLKMKPCEDDEAVITGFEVVMHNEDAGNSKRAENLYEGDRAGKIVALWKGKTIRVGTGFSHSEAKRWWDNQEEYIGKMFKFKYMELTPYGEPRGAVFQGFRSKEDMS